MSGGLRRAKPKSMIFISEFSLSSVKSRFCKAIGDTDSNHFFSAKQNWCIQELTKLDIKTRLTCLLTHVRVKQFYSCFVEDCRVRMTLRQIIQSSEKHSNSLSKAYDPVRLHLPQIHSVFRHFLLSEYTSNTSGLRSLCTTPTSCM